MVPTAEDALGERTIGQNDRSWSGRAVRYEVGQWSLVEQMELDLIRDNRLPKGRLCAPSPCQAEIANADSFDLASLMEFLHPTHRRRDRHKSVWPMHLIEVD